MLHLRSQIKDHLPYRRQPQLHLAGHRLVPHQQRHNHPIRAVLLLVHKQMHQQAEVNDIRWQQSIARLRKRRTGLEVQPVEEEVECARTASHTTKVVCHHLQSVFRKAKASMVSSRISSIITRMACQFSHEVHRTDKTVKITDDQHDHNTTTIEEMDQATSKMTDHSEDHLHNKTDKTAHLQEVDREDIHEDQIQMDLVTMGQTIGSIPETRAIMHRMAADAVGEWLVTRSDREEVVRGPKILRRRLKTFRRDSALTKGIKA